MGDYSAMDVNHDYKNENGNDNSYDGSSPDNGNEQGSRSSLLNLPILRGFGQRNPTKSTGQAPKRRGPKPDSKPALSRRQELNRQAQRTHRERKELYIKALEQEVLKLKETFGQTVQERDQLKEENQRLRDALAAHGIHLEFPIANASSSSGSISGSYPSAPQSIGASTSPPPMSASYGDSPIQNHSLYTNLATGIDYDQAGIDFVLALERPCMDHMQQLCVRSHEEEDQISGHSLMFTCPPTRHLIERPDVLYPNQAPEAGAGDLLRLLDLSNRLPLDGEITPVMAWSSILWDERAHLLSLSDIHTLRDDLQGKIKCYGFGAVLEEFEVADSLKSVFMNKGIEDGYNGNPLTG